MSMHSGQYPASFDKLRAITYRKSMYSGEYYAYLRLGSTWPQWCARCNVRYHPDERLVRLPRSYHMRNKYRTPYMRTIKVEQIGKVKEHAFYLPSYRQDHPKVPYPTFVQRRNITAMSESAKPTAITHFDSAAEHYEKYTGGCTREVARHLVQLSELEGMFKRGAVVLDNACGTGIVAEEITQHCLSTNGPLPEVYAFDPAPNMVRIAENKIAAMESSSSFSFQIMPGEALDFPDEKFTHSITNLGILFFTDADAGAKEIYRTLKPGGIAVVTSWSSLGYLDEVIRPAQIATRPDDPPYQLPINPAWFLPQHVEQCLSRGGFEKVVTSKLQVHYGASSFEEARALLVDSFRAVWKDWSDEERSIFNAEVLKCLERSAVKYTMVDGNEGYGVPMEAIVAVCHK